MNINFKKIIYFIFNINFNNYIRVINKYHINIINLKKNRTEDWDYV